MANRLLSAFAEELSDIEDEKRRTLRENSYYNFFAEDLYAFVEQREEWMDIKDAVSLYYDNVSRYYRKATSQTAKDVFVVGKYVSGRILDVFNAMEE